MKQALSVVVGIVVGSTFFGCSDANVDEDAIETRSSALTGIAKGIRHDFDGDGKEDVIFVTPGGSYEYLGAAPSGWTANAWVRTDLKKGLVSYVAGDFNGDTRSDLVITTASGSYLYTGKVGGGFTANVWINNSYTLGNVEFTPGDFNGDNFTDLMVTTSIGTEMISGKSSGGFDTLRWWSGALRKGTVAFTRGNFNGDAATDLLVTTSSGTSEYTGKVGSPAGFNLDVWTNSSFTLGSARFTPADYNGDFRGDFFVQTMSGAALYTGRSTGGFNANVWTSSSYGISVQAPLAGDYNGDGKWDVLISSQDDSEGTILLQGTASSGFTGRIWGDPRYHFYDSVLYRGDYNGDGRDDFLASARIDLGLGTRENTGKTGTGGFNSDVWIRNDLDRDTVVVY